MKLFVIVLCLLSERFLVHISSHHRFHWFILYSQGVLSKCSASLPTWVKLSAVVLPLLTAVGLVLYGVNAWLFGFIELMLNIGLFYYCLGPVNPFYPGQKHSEDDAPTQEARMDYLAQVNGQLFAPLFWYIIAGPLGMLTYRLIMLCQDESVVSEAAAKVLGLLDWVPCRMTGLFYLLVGHFQKGFLRFRATFFSPPSMNQIVLRESGLSALEGESHEEKTMLHAERLVEHATIFLLVLLAVCNMIAWVNY